MIFCKIIWTVIDLLTNLIYMWSDSEGSLETCRFLIQVETKFVPKEVSNLLHLELIFISNT